MSETVTIGDIVLKGATSVEDSGGWQTAEKRTEEGYDYQTRVRAEPLEASIEAWVAKDDLPELRELRQQREPVPASVGTVSISRVAVEDLSVENEPSPTNKERVTVELREQVEATIESAEINIETEAGSLGTAAEETEPSTAQSEDNDGGAVEDETGGIVNSLASVREGLSNVL